MANKNSRAWKMERASVNSNATARPRTNKYSGNDTGKKPAPGGRQKAWVGGYTKADGTYVEGYYRSIPS
jgi:hypothetical protein